MKKLDEVEMLFKMQGALNDMTTQNLKSYAMRISRLEKMFEGLAEVVYNNHCANTGSGLDWGKGNGKRW